jgi:adiponectin receptor
MSIRLRRFDYAGISIMIAGSCTPALYLGFLCDELTPYRWGYLGSMWVLSFIAAIITFFPDRTNATFRAVVFILAGWSILPGIIHLRYYMEPEYLPSFPINCWLIGGIVYALGAIIYAASIPERWFKRTFDLFGASHQIFHLMVLVGALLHIRASMLTYLTRVANPCPVREGEF